MIPRPASHPRTFALAALLTLAPLAPREALADQSFDEEEVNLVLTRATRQAQANCAKVRNAEGRMAGPWGNVTVTVVLNHTSGRIKDVFVDDAFDDTPTGRCVEGAYKLLVVPPWSGKDRTLERLVVLDKPAEAEEEERAAQEKASKKGAPKGKKK
jgi:hypothetical protein